MSAKETFLKLFPVPNFLKMPSVGLDISDGDIRFIELIETSQGRRPGRFGRISLPEGVVKNGEIANKVEFVKILKSIKKEFGTSFVRVSIIEKNSYIFRTQIQKTGNMSYEDIRANISFKIEENVPMKLEDSVFGFDLIKETKNNLDVVVSVLPEYIVEQFIESLGGAGLIPLAFEVESHAVARAVVNKGDRGTYMVIDFRNTRVGISIFSDGFVQLTSTFDMGGNELIGVIKRQLDVSDEEAEKIKKEIGFIKRDGQEELFYAMINSISALKDEINKYIVYWHTHKEVIKKPGENGEAKKIEKIILSGASASLKGLSDYISISTGVPVEEANVWRNMFSLDDFVPKMNFDTSLEYAAAIGLAMDAYRT